MKHILQVLVFVITGGALLWFGYSILFRPRTPARQGGGPPKRRGPIPKGEGLPGESQTCPVCSAKLESGRLVSSTAFPSLNGGKDRFMHIRGCIYCLNGERDRICPVCGIILEENEILICRLYERMGSRSHVHVLGCTQCKGLPSGRSSSRFL